MSLLLLEMDKTTKKKWQQGYIHAGSLSEYVDQIVWN